MTNITITDIQRAGYCGTGARRWFTARGLNFRAFMRDGLPIETVRAMDDALAQRVVAVKEDTDGR